MTILNNILQIVWGLKTPIVIIGIAMMLNGIYLAIFIGLVLWYYYNKLEVAINGGDFNIFTIWEYLQQDCSWMLDKYRMEWSREKWDKGYIYNFDFTEDMRNKKSTELPDDFFIKNANEMLPPKGFIIFNHLVIPMIPVLLYLAFR